ncbi:hypothetical protein DNTS_016952, partial [Danionella cerebrum]
PPGVDPVRDAGSGLVPNGTIPITPRGSSPELPGEPEAPSPNEPGFGKAARCLMTAAVTTTMAPHPALHLARVLAVLLTSAAAAGGQLLSTVAPHDSQLTHTFPSRLVFRLNEATESALHQLDTRTRSSDSQDVHLAQVSFQLQAFGTHFILDLTLNNELLSSDYVELHYERGERVQWKGGEHCYYHGRIRGKEDSRVALSTCEGLNGVFDDGSYMYTIEPLRDAHGADGRARPHVLHRMLMLRENTTTPDKDSEGDSSRRRTKRAIPRNMFEEMRYIELMIVTDHNMFRRQKTKQHTRNYAKSVVNVVDAIFKEHLNTRVVLVGMEIWTERDLIPLGVNPFQMLRDFSRYRQKEIKQNADAVHLFTNVTFHYSRSNVAYFGGICSVSRGVGVIEYGSSLTRALLLSQSLAQNLGIQWDPLLKRKECGCENSWLGCIMEDTGVQHPRSFSKCSVAGFREFLLKGGGSCLFNKPTKLFEETECGNGYVEPGEECDCGPRDECYRDCCKKCSLSNGAHCSDGPCCNNTCLFYPRGITCRFAVNDCDISETCSGDSGLAVSSEKFCYEKLNTEGSEKGSCGRDGDQWIQCGKHDVFCGYLLCTNIGEAPRIGVMKGEITETSFNHQGRLMDCSGGHVLLEDQTDLGYVGDGTPCGPSMMCLDRKCLPIQHLNLSSCPSGPKGHVCSRPSATNLIIGSIAGAILVAAIVLGGTGWGFKNVKRRGYDPNASAIYYCNNLNGWCEVLFSAEVNLSHPEDRSFGSFLTRAMAESLDFQAQLLTVQNSLSDEELQALLFLCSDHISSRELSTVSSGCKLLDLLQTRDLLTPDDTSLLTELLSTIRRHSLVRELSGQSNGSAEHRRHISRYRNIKFLLKQTLTRRKLEKELTLLQLFLEMEKEALLDEDNLDFLEKILVKAFPSLQKQIIQYKAERLNEALVSLETEESSFPAEEPSLPVSPLSAELMEREVDGFRLAEDLSQSVDFSSGTESSCLNRAVKPLVEQYVMSAERRGLCVIFNNYDFSECSLPNREGTHIDRDRLERVFFWLGFEVLIREDCTRGGLLRELEDLAARDHTLFDCFVCCVLSHGRVKGILGVDGLIVSFQDLMSTLGPLKCPSLQHKPKLFFIQACRGDREQRPVCGRSVNREGEELSSDAAVPQDSTPEAADFLLAMSTVPHYVSFRDRAKGSWFIQTLCHNLTQLVPRDVDLLSILTKVNADVSRKTDKSGLRKQMPQPEFTLTKTLVFPRPSTLPPLD